GLVDGELTYEQRQHLAVLLRDNPELQQKYRDYMLLDAMLRWEQPAVTPAPEPAATPRSRLWRLGMYLAGPLAAGLLLAVGLALWPRGRTTAGTDEEHSDDSVAVLLRTTRAEWGESTVPTRPGAPLSAGWLRLKSGHAHIEFYSGATVVLEGPAELELI